MQYRRLSAVTFMIGCIVLFLRQTIPLQAEQQRVQVFILAGQSNMEGHGQVRSLDHLEDHPQYGHLLETLQDENGDWAVRDDVAIYWAANCCLVGHALAEALLDPAATTPHEAADKLR